MAEGESSAPVQAPAGGLAPGAVELFISNLLRSGVALSLTLVLVGMTLSALNHPDAYASPTALSPLLAPAHGPRSLETVLRHAREVRGQAFVMLGLLVMMAVPVLRVVIALLTFRQQRDRAFVRVTSVVLALLALSLLLGKAAE